LRRTGTRIPRKRSPSPYSPGPVLKNRPRNFAASGSASSWRSFSISSMFAEVSGMSTRRSRSRPRIIPRIALGKGEIDDAVDELSLRLRIRLSIGGRRLAEPARAPELRLFVLPHGRGGLPQVVAERQCAALFLSARLHDVAVMRMRPLFRTVEERGERIVGARHVRVPQLGEEGRVRLDRMQLGHGDLNVDHRLRGEPRYAAPT